MGKREKERERGDQQIEEESHRDRNINRERHGEINTEIRPHEPICQP